MTRGMRVAVTLWPWILAFVILAPLMTPGYVLSYDMVWVPDLAMRSDFLGLGTGLPRAVPSDAVVALVDEVVPGMLLQKVVLVAAVVLAGVGARKLVPADSGVAQLAATSLYVWNPFVAERLGIGHWPLLLAYAALPWVFDAARRLVVGERTMPQLVLWVALASLSAAGGIMATVMAVVAVAGRGGASARRAAVVVSAAVAVNAPWLLAGLAHSGSALSDPAGIAAFATRPEGILAAPLAALGLGGIWNAEVVPVTRLGPAAVVWLVAVLAVAALGVRRWARVMPPRDRLTLLAVAAVGYTAALAGTLLPGLMEWLVASVPGAGLLRDGSRFLGLLAPLEASLFGTGAAVAAELVRERVGRVALAAGAVLAPLALMPDLAWGLVGDLKPVQYPEEYAEARSLLLVQNATSNPGRLLSLPLSSYRMPSWNHDRRTLDPIGRYMPLNYVSSDVLYVSGSPLRGEDPLAADVARILAGTPEEGMATALREQGVAWVVRDLESERMVDDTALSPQVPTAEEVFEGAWLRMTSLGGVEEPGVGPSPHGVALILGGWALACITLGAALIGRFTVRRRDRADSPGSGTALSD